MSRRRDSSDRYGSRASVTGSSWLCRARPAAPREGGVEPATCFEPEDPLSARVAVLVLDVLEATRFAPDPELDVLGHAGNPGASARRAPSCGATTLLTPRACTRRRHRRSLGDPSDAGSPSCRSRRHYTRALDHVQPLPGAVAPGRPRAQRLLVALAFRMDSRTSLVSRGPADEAGERPAARRLRSKRIPLLPGVRAFYLVAPTRD